MLRIAVLLTMKLLGESFEGRTLSHVLQKGLFPLNSAKDRRGSSRSERVKGRSGIWESGPAWLACLEVCSWPYRRPLGTWWETLRMSPWPSLSAVPPHHLPLALGTG